MIVYVITDSEAGWNCIDSVYVHEEDALKRCQQLDPLWNGDSKWIMHEEELR